MTTYRIKTLEWFETIAEYEIEAESKEQAIEMVKNGEVAYDQHEHPGNDDKWGEVLEIESDEEDDDDVPSWIDRHSVNCIVCGRMYDERNSIADGIDGGEVCPDHENDLDKLVADGIIEPREE